MTVEQKRSLVRAYCGGATCTACVLDNKEWKNRAGINGSCLSIAYATEEELDIALSLINQTGSSPENGGNNMEKPTITINLERYDELIKKEVLYDELTKNKGINMYLYQEVKEPLREGANNE